MSFNKPKALQEADKLVSQGKISQAIKQYLQIVEKDPSDLALLNTVGDLYIREKNAPEALKHFHKLADGYVREGFTVKAIAIYKKISKLDPNTIDPLLKLAELYVVQGLGREAREQYTQAVEFYKKKNQNDKALEIYRKIVQLDPENNVYRARFAEFCEQTGRKADAAQAYLETVEMALRSGDTATAEPALKKAANLDAKNPQVHLLRARLAAGKQQPQEVERIIASVPELKENPAAQRLLLDSYLASGKLEAAEKLLVKVFRANPTAFDPLASFTALCIGKGDFDAALKPLAEVADELVELKNTGPLKEVLRQIWATNSQHVPTLELMYHICEKTADELTLPEVLEALGHAHVQDGELEKAEMAYRKLVEREPENENYKELLHQVLQKQGKEAVPASPAALEEAELVLGAEADLEAAAVSTAPEADAEQASSVKEALENSDLYSRYGLVDQAVAELEKVLAVYPDQVDLHQRILEVCQKNRPDRAAQAAGELARIYSQRGDLTSAKKYEGLAGGVPTRRPSEAPAMPGAGVESEVPLTVMPSEPAAAEIDLSADIPVVQPKGGPAAGPREVPLDLAASPPAASEVEAAAPAKAEAHEFDLSGDLEAMTAGVSSPAAKPQAPPFNYEDSLVEVDFYLGQGFTDEAMKAVESLEENYPGNPQVAELRRRVEEHASRTAAPVKPVAPLAKGPEPSPAEPEAVTFAPIAEPELPSAFDQPVPAQAAYGGEPAPTRPAETVPAGLSPTPPAPPAVGGDLLGSLAGDLESSLEGLEPAAPRPAPPAAVKLPPAKVSAASSSPLSGLLDELAGGPAEPAAQEDPETHYNLGVAFREMGLLDEAIGEFQKVVKGAQKGKFPPNFLQACSLLAVCFMDKKMPVIAVKWYLRALETPGLDEEGMLALQYDLGVAYEQAGDTRTALEKFSEVYSLNIDFRDVAEKIRSLQQKSS